MPAMLFIPFPHSGVLVHMLDDIAPADAGIVSTEADLAFLSPIRDDAHLGATKIVIEQILEPHSCDEKEVPAIRAPLGDVFLAAVAIDAPVILAGQAEGLIEFLEELPHIEL